MTFEIKQDLPDLRNTIRFVLGPESDQTEMLRISHEGFFVRGVAVAQDEQEAAVVYNAFKEFLTWSAITRQY